MLRTLRQNTKIVLWVVIVGFVGMIVLAWGMDITGRKSRSQIMGEVNGQKISIQSFRRAVQQAIAQQREQAETDPDYGSIVRDTWDTFVRELLFQQEIEKRNIRVNDAEIVHYLHTNPPPGFQNVDIFQTDDQFDMSKYLEFLDDPSSMQDRTKQQLILYAEQYARMVLPS